MKKIHVAVLGATGLVGQRFVQLLGNHPWFDLAAVTASPKSTGKKYFEAVKWYIDDDIPDKAKELTILDTTPKALENSEVDLVFSALPSYIAKEVELKFAEAGFFVASNVGVHRLDKDVPLLIPEVNPNHVKIIEKQQTNRNYAGWIVTSANCTTTILALPLKPIHDCYCIKKVIVATMQAVSGAGYEGVPSMAIVDNVIPYIEGEEEKVQKELLKIFGELKDDAIIPASFRVSSSCNRVPVLDGHMECVFVETESEVETQKATKILREFNGEPQRLKLPTAPEKPIIVMDDPFRPQPRFDRNLSRGMSVSVGRLRSVNVFDNGIGFVVLGHNTIRGAAGGAMLNAELLCRYGYM